MEVGMTNANQTGQGKLYMAIEKSIYEFPIACAETPKELAEICGVPEVTVRSGIFRQQHGMPTRYIAVEFELDEDEKPPAIEFERKELDLDIQVFSADDHRQLYEFLKDGSRTTFEIQYESKFEAMSRRDALRRFAKNRELISCFGDYETVTNDNKIIFTKKGR